MTDKYLLNLTKLASSTENTPELEAYWEKRYNEFLDRGLFTISSKTVDILATQGPLDKPATPFGDLILLKHLDRNQGIDEIALQTSIETAVRLLDAILDKANFTTESEYIVNQYRKIGIGLADFKEYLEARKATSELDEIDYIGNLVSSSTYRASESLAEEKGVCSNWDKIKKHLRPKSFEYWYDTESGEIKSGLEMIDQFDQSTVEKSNFEIVPRRNSNILLFSPDLEWQIWSDRDSSSPKTEIDYLPIQNSEEIVKTPLETLLEKESLPEKITEPAPEIIETQKEEMAEPLLTGNDTVDKDKELLLTEFQVEQAEEIIPETETVEPENTFEQIAEPNLEATEELPVLGIEPLYQIGELVQVNSEQKDDHLKVYQVIDVEELENGEFNYSLTGGADSLETEKWLEIELEPVELTTILDKINLPVEITEPIIKIKENIRNQVHAVLITNNQVLLERTELGLELPGGLLIKNRTPEQTLVEVLFEKYGLESQVTYEIGASITPSNDENPSILHLGFTVNSEVPAGTDLVWLDMAKTSETVEYTQEIIAKLQSQQQYFQKTIAPQETLQNQISKTKSQESNIINNFSNNFKILPQNNKNMSKYALKLEQLVKTNAFGDVIVTLQYDGKGPKLVSASSDSLDPELKHLLDTVLGLVNFTLSKNIAPSELASQLEAELKGAMHLPINGLLKVIAASLKEAPASVDQINPNNLLEVLPEMVKQFTENAGMVMPQESAEMDDEMQEEESSTTEDNTKPADSETPQQNKGFFGNFGS